MERPGWAHRITANGYVKFAFAFAFAFSSSFESKSVYIDLILLCAYAKASSVGGGTNVCVGDINRMCSQESRGGGTVCTEGPAGEASLWTSFNTAIAGVEDCWEYNPCTGSSSQCYWCSTGSPTLSPTPAPTSVPAPTLTFAPSVYVGENVSTGEVAVIVFNSGEQLTTDTYDGLVSSYAYFCRR